MYEYWRDNPDALSDEDLINYYIENYFNHRLKDLDSFELLKTLNQGFGRDIILLCHEKMSMDLSKGSFCHRALVADYIELKSGIIIPEISIDEKGNIEEIKRLSYKPKLSELINGKLVL